LCYLSPRKPVSRPQSDNPNLKVELFISQQKEMLQSDLEPSPLSRDVFRNPDEDGHEDGGPYKATDQLLKNLDLIMVALTAPNANRNYDYERLEFYGDSVISFLVILELFVTKNYAYKEGPLDFFRIQQVSNMNFFEINIKQGFYKYMINEPQTIFNDFVPGAFEGLKYQERIKHKALNELDNKIKFLRKERCYVSHLLEWVVPVKKSNNNNPKSKAAKGGDRDTLADEQFLTELRLYYLQYGRATDHQQQMQQLQPQFGSGSPAQAVPQTTEKHLIFTEDRI